MIDTRPAKDRIRDNQLRRNYGITLDDYNRLNNEQNGVCAICRQPEVNKQLSVDHDHKTGKVRRLLCSKHNTALGLVEEDIVILETMIEYLKVHSNSAHV